MFVAALAACCIVPARGEAAEVPELNTDRPDFTESAEVVPRGSLQFEGGYDFNTTGNNGYHAVGETLVRFGLLRWWELRLGLNSWLWEDGNTIAAGGKDDVSVGMKFQLLRKNNILSIWKPDAALILETALPSGSGDYRENMLQPSIKLALSWPVSPWFDIGINVGYVYAGENGCRFHQFIESVVAGFSLGERWWVYLEFYCIQPEERKSSDAHYVDGGLAFSVGEDLQLDAKAGYRIDRGSEEYYFGAGAVLRIPGLF